MIGLALWCSPFMSDFFEETPHIFHLQITAIDVTNSVEMTVSSQLGELKQDNVVAIVQPVLGVESQSAESIGEALAIVDGLDVLLAHGVFEACFREIGRVELESFTVHRDKVFRRSILTVVLDADALTHAHAEDIVLVIFRCKVRPVIGAIVVKVGSEGVSGGDESVFVVEGVSF